MSLGHPRLSNAGMGLWRKNYSCNQLPCNVSKSTTSGKTAYRLRPMTIEEIEQAARADRDAQPLTEADLKRMKRTPQAKIIRRAQQFTEQEFTAAVVENGDAALPALIDCLSDTRPIRFAFKNSQVSLGFVCLDILIAVARPKFFAIPDCSDDGLGACIKPSFYFRPDADTAAIARVEQNWLRAYGQGRVTFQYPSWWKPQGVSASKP